MKEFSCGNFGRQRQPAELNTKSIKYFFSPSRIALPSFIKTSFHKQNKRNRQGRLRGIHVKNPTDSRWCKAQKNAGYGQRPYPAFPVQKAEQAV
jgi:hypothetical protein